MKVLILSSYLGRPGALVGGGETYAEILARLLADRGHEVIFGCWQAGMTGLASAGRTLSSRQIRIRSAMDLCALVTLVRVIRHDRIGLIIANSPKEYWPAIIAAGLTGTRVILIRHLTRSISAATRTMINMAADCVVAVSRTVSQALLRSGINEKIIRVITNGVPVDELASALPERDSTRSGIGFSPQDIVIGFAGRLHPEKGLILLIRAFGRIAGRYPRTRLLIVGEGPDRKAVEEELLGTGLADRVKFVGRVSPVYRMYAAMDIFVMPSVCEEAFGFAAAEAMAMGKPVIASSTGGLAELIIHESTGLLVPLGDDEALASAIARLIGNPAEAASYAAAGRERVCNFFSDHIQGDLMNRLVMSVMEGRP